MDVSEVKGVLILYWLCMWEKVPTFINFTSYIILGAGYVYIWMDKK